MGEVRRRCTHPTLYCCIHLTNAVYLVRNQSSKFHGCQVVEKRLDLVVMDKSTANGIEVEEKRAQVELQAGDARKHASRSCDHIPTDLKHSEINSDV